jgi:hypothetical protein
MSEVNYEKETAGNNNTEKYFAEIKEYCRKKFDNARGWKIKGLLFKKLESLGCDVQEGDTLIWDPGKCVLYTQHWVKR